VTSPKPWPDANGVPHTSPWAEPELEGCLAAWDRSELTYCCILVYIRRMPTLSAANDESKIRDLRRRAEQMKRSIDGLLRDLDALREPQKKGEGRVSPQPSPLDEVHELLTATEDLRLANGRLSAILVAKAFGVSLNELAGWLGRSRQSVAKTPDADSLQDELGFFERVARLRAVVPQERFLKWLRIPNAQLDGDPPLKLMAKGERQVVVDFVEDMLTGAPT
jgi:hypothetical protein